MTALMNLRRFECAAYKVQNENSRAPLTIESDTGVIDNQSASQRRALNQKTWQAFRHCLIEIIGMEKFLWICRRYKLDAAKMEERGRPLLAEHVELFSIGAGQQFTRDVKRLCPGSKIKQLTRQELHEKLKQAQPFQNILGKYLNPMHIYGTPTELRAWFIFDRLLMDKEKQLLFSDALHINFSAFLERFCKATVNRELIEKQIIPVPGHDGQLDFYRVYKKIYTGDGLVAYALKPAAVDSSLKPLLVFRQTQFCISGEDALPSYLNDLEPSVGKSGYDKAKSRLDHLVNHSSFLSSGEKMEVAGYSLGGTHAQRFMADYHPKISSAHFYSDPSVDEETAQRFAREIQSSNRDEPLSLSIFRTKGDVIHYVGKQHLGCNLNHPKVNIELYETDHENREVAVLTLHAFKMFDNTQFNYRMHRVNNSAELFNHLDNTKRGPEVLWYEKMRQIWGRLLYGYFYLLQGITRGLEIIFGIKFLRSSQDN